MGFLWTPGTSPLPLLGACVFLNPWNFASPVTWGLSQLYVYWSKNRLISVMVPPRALTDSALRVWPTGTPRAFSTWSFPGVLAPIGNPKNRTSLASNLSLIWLSRQLYLATLSLAALTRLAASLSQMTVGSTTRSLTKVKSGFILPFGPSRTGSQWTVQPCFSALFARILHNELCRSILLRFTEGHHPEMCPHVSVVIPHLLHLVVFVYRAMHSRVGMQFVLRRMASMVSPFVNVPARIQELHSLYLIHVVDPIPWVAWLARYSHHLFLGIALSLVGSSSAVSFLPVSAGLQRGYFLQRSSGVSLTPSPLASFLIVSLFVFQQSLWRPLMVSSGMTSSRHVMPSPPFRVLA